MLAITETPRPRPPAKMRQRSNPNLTTPPPAYGTTFGSPPTNDDLHVASKFLEPPMSGTWWDLQPPADHLEQSQPPRSPIVSSNSLSDDFRDELEKSREEIVGLLIKADDIIKERENELGLTSAVCKTLYQNNVALKSKHQALLARLPSMSPCGSTSSPAGLSRLASENSTISYSSSDSAINFNTTPPTTIFRGHTRKVSMSTADISLLADQNAELLHKLEKLESESTTADQAGRRELKRLEKEIMVLREALEKTQAKSEELEEKTKTGFGWGAEKVVEEVWRKKKEREAKFRAMRNLGRDYTSEEDVAEPGVRNFAPEGSRFGGPSGSYSFFPATPSPFPRHAKSNSLGGGLFAKSSGLGEINPGFYRTMSHPEHTLISQLLSKVQELEETNSKILNQQEETANQLQAVQRDTEHISKVYECLVDPNNVELELMEANAKGKADVSTADTIRFRSLRRNIETQLLNGRSVAVNTTKTRRSVVGLFEDTRQHSPADLDASKSPNFPVPFPSSPWSEGRHLSSWSRKSTGLASPALSSLSFCEQASPVSSRPTLESELGNEFLNNWGEGAGNLHLRTTSLYDLSQLSVAPSRSPSPSPVSPSPISRKPLPPSEPPVKEAPLSPVSLMSCGGGLQLSVEPPTPDNALEKEARRAATTPKSPRQQRMSQTLRSRTHRWVDGRFGGNSVLAASKDVVGLGPSSSVGLMTSTVQKKKPSRFVPKQITSAIDTMMENFDGARSAAESSPQEQEPDTPQASDDSDDAGPDSPQSDRGVDNNEFQLQASPPPKKRGKPGFGALLLEVWLWFQFGIIILVFLWAMAKRGPKAVLAEGGGGERKRAVSTRHR